jgi:ADP-ribose pyrophosphatase YjhB (NUDIX family)
MPMSDYMRSIRSKVGTQLLEIPSVSVLAFDEQDRVTLVRHAEVDLWTTPGGAVEPEEVPADAAVREMWEETGLHVELLRVLGIYGGPEFTTSYRNGDAVSFMMTVFLARRIDGTPRPDGEETLDVRSFARDEIAGLDMQPWAPRVVLQAFEDRERGDETPPYFDPPGWAPSSDSD